MGDRVEVRPQDYRELAGEQFDAVASIELGEDVGERPPARGGIVSMNRSPDARDRAAGLDV